MPWKKTDQAQQRLSLALQMVRGHKPVVVLCREFGVSRKTAYLCLARFKYGGKSGLNLRQAGRPKGFSPLQRKWCWRVLALRRARPSWGARKLRWWLAQKNPGQRLPSRRTIQRWLACAGCVRTRRRRLRAGSGLSAQVKVIAPNDVWTFDFKGDFTTKDGTRVIALTVRDQASRFVLAVQPVKQLSTALLKGICTRLFGKYGLPRAVRTDHGVPFCGSGPYGLTSLSLWWIRLGIEVQFVDRAKGINNNSHEQMHRMFKAEAINPASVNFNAQLRRIHRWRRLYNWGRPHESLSDQTPALAYKKSKRRMPNLRAAVYPKGWITRRVRPHGWIKLNGSAHHIGRAFEGLIIGFKLTSPKVTIYFEHRPIGTLDLTQRRSGLVPLASVPNKGGSYAPSLRPSPAL